MLRPSPIHGTQRLPNDDDDYNYDAIYLHTSDIAYHQIILTSVAITTLHYWKHNSVIKKTNCNS